jgi:hypothetical protein
MDTADKFADIYPNIYGYRHIHQIIDADIHMDTAGKFADIYPNIYGYRHIHQIINADVHMDTAGKYPDLNADKYVNKHKDNDGDPDGEHHTDPNADFYGDADVNAVGGDADIHVDGDGMYMRYIHR